MESEVGRRGSATMYFSSVTVSPWKVKQSECQELTIGVFELLVLRLRSWMANLVLRRFVFRG